MKKFLFILAFVFASSATFATTIEPTPEKGTPTAAVKNTPKSMEMQQVLKQMETVIADAEIAVVEEQGLVCTVREGGEVVGRCWFCSCARFAKAYN